MISIILSVISIFFYLRRNYFPSLMIFFFLLFDGFQVVPLKILTDGSFSGATSDFALFIFFGLFLLRGRVWLKHSIVKESFSKCIFVFVGLVLLNFLYGLFAKGYSFGDVFKGGRSYFLVLIFLMFTEIPLRLIHEIIKTLIIITFFQSVLFLLQFVVGHSLLQGPKELQDENLSYIRFYNVPKLLDFSIAVILFWNPFKNLKWVKWFVIFIFACAIVGTLSRGYLLAWFFAIGLFSLIFNRLDRKILYIISIVIIGFGVLSISVVQKRIDTAMEELTVLESISSGHIILEENTFTYRIEHLTERVNYIVTQPMGWLFGIGLVDEKAPQVYHLPFHNGLADPITGRVQQVYTPDIVWSMLFLTLGFVGGFLYVYIFVRILFRFSKSKIIPEVSKIIFVLIILYFMTSFTSIGLILPSFYVPIFLLITVIKKYQIILLNKKVNAIPYDKKAFGFNNNGNLR